MTWAWWLGAVATLGAIVSVASLLRRQTPERRARFSWSRLVLGGLVAAGLVLPGFMGFFAQTSRLVEDWDASWAQLLVSVCTLALVAGLVGLAAATARGRALARLPRWQFLLLCIGGASLLRLAYLLLVDMAPRSDFELMWSTAVQWAERGEFPRELDGTERRALPLFYPLALAFGRATEVYELANIAVAALTLWLTYWLARRYAGEALARASLVVIVPAPETLFALAVPSHDVAGTAFLLGAVVLAHCTWDCVRRRKLPLAFALAVLTGLVWQILAIQRGNTVVLAAAVVVWFLTCIVPGVWSRLRLGRGLQQQRVVRRGVLSLLLLVVVPWVVWKSTSAAFNASEVVASALERKGRWQAGNTDSWAGGSYTYANKNYYSHYQPISPKQGGGGPLWQRLARGKIISDIYYNTNELPGYVTRKAGWLFSLGEPISWYLERASLGDDSIVRDTRTIRMLRAYSRTYSAVFLLVLALGALASIFYARWRVGVALPVLALAIQSGALVLLGEVQSRYMYPIWYVGPLLLAATLAGIRRRPPQDLASRKLELGAMWASAWPKFALLGAGVAALLLGLLAFGHAWQGRMLDMRQFREVSASYRVQPGFLQSIQAKHPAKQVFQLKLQHARRPAKGQSISVTRSVPVAGDAPRTLRLLVRGQGPLPEGKSTRPPTVLEARISVNGRLAQQIPVASKMRGVVVSIPGIKPREGHVELTFSLVALGKGSRTLAPVYFEFVDLVPTTKAHKLLPSRAPGPAPRKKAASLTFDEWLQVLDPKKLGNALRRPESALEELRRRRLSEPPLVSFSSTARARQRADELLQNGFKLRQNPTIRIGEPIDWGANPKSDSNWHFLVNGMSRFDSLMEADAGRGDTKYYRALRSTILDWIDYNLVKDLPNAKKWHDMGTGHRALPLAYVLDQELRRSEADPAIVRRLIWATYKHVEFLSDPEYLASGNHAIFMMTGLGWLLKALPEINEHAELQRYTNKNMRDLLKRQFGGDAFHREHSPGYHLFAVSSFQNVKRTGLFDDIKELSDTLARAKTHHQELRHPNGNLVALGDTDRGSPQSIARYAKRGLEPHAGGYSASGKLESGPLRVYRDDGYAIFREGWPDKPSLDDDYLFLGAGFHSSGHKHPDHLSFEWSFRGQPILVDSGKFTYTKGDWKRFFNSTRAGNSVEVDDKDYTRRNEHAIGSAIESSGTLGDLFYVYCRQKHPVVKVRQDRLLLWRPGHFLLVVDQMDSQSRHTYRQWFHFHENLKVERDGASLEVPLDNGRKLFVSSFWKSPSIELHRGETKPRIQGWVSPAYNVKVPRYSVAFRQKGANSTFATLFSNGPVANASITNDAGGLAVGFSVGGKRTAFRFSPSDGARVVSIDE